jgi:hypothetical protein
MSYPALLWAVTPRRTMPFDRLDGEAPAIRLPDTALELLRVNRRPSKRWAAVSFFVRENSLQAAVVERKMIM